MIFASLLEFLILNIFSKKTVNQYWSEVNFIQKSIHYDPRSKSAHKNSRVFTLTQSLRKNVAPVWQWMKRILLLVVEEREQRHQSG